MATYDQKPKHLSELIHNFSDFTMPPLILFSLLMVLKSHLHKKYQPSLYLVGCMAIIGMAYPAQSLPAYDCSKPQLSGSYSLLALRKCREANPDQVTSVVEDYHVYEGLQTEEIRAKICKVQVAYFVAYCGMHSHGNVLLQDSFPEIEIPTASECEDYHASKRFQRANSVKMLTINSTDIMRVVLAGTLSNDGSCTTGSITLRGTTFNYVVALATYAITTQKSSIMFNRETGLGDDRYSHCSLKARTCVIDGQRIIYERPETNCGYTYLKSIRTTTLYGFMYNENVSDKMYVPACK